MSFNEPQVTSLIIWLHILDATLYATLYEMLYEIRKVSRPTLCCHRYMIITDELTNQPLECPNENGCCWCYHQHFEIVKNYMRIYSSKSFVLPLSVKLVIAGLLMAGLVTTTRAAIESMETNVLDSKGRPKDDPRYMEIRTLEEQEQRGVSLYRSGKYEKAYEVLSEPARLGFKRAQHSIALMHIQGQSVQKNLLIGTALFGLAVESGDRKLLKEHAKLLEMIPEKFTSLVKKQTEYYIERYGMEVQGIICTREKPSGSHFTVVECRKQPGNYKGYPWAP